jgi:phage terminase large subunit-like protein
MKRVIVFFLSLILVVAMFSEARANRAIKFIELLKHTKDPFYGQPFKLLDWERNIIRDFFGTVNEQGLRQYDTATVFIPKKNGKSELAAGAGLYHVFADGVRNGEVYGCAVDRGQASIVFDVAVDMIDQVPALKKRTWLQLSGKKLTDKVSGTFYRVLSADAFRKHGYNLSACVFDEIHAQPNRNLWDVMSKGAGDARSEPAWWVISTAGDDPDRLSIGWELYELAKKVMLARQTGDIENDLPYLYPVIFEYPGDDIYNEANWALANPSMGHTFTVEKMRRAAAEAKQNPSNERTFRWLRLNQWPTTKISSWLPLDLFDQTIGDWNRNDLAGKDCFVGMDLSSTTDLTAICAMFPPQGKQRDWRVIWDTFIPKINMADRIKNDHVPYDVWEKAGWITATEGDVIDYTVVRERILTWKTLYNIQEIDSDRALATMLLQELEQKGLTCVDIPQTMKDMTDPLNQTEIFLRWKEPKDPSEEDKLKEQLAAILKAVIPDLPVGESATPTSSLLVGRMTHENNLVARWCFGNSSIAQNGNGQKKLVKEHQGKSVVRTKRIDTTAALVDAMARARFYKGKMDLSDVILAEGWGM